VFELCPHFDSIEWGTVVVDGRKYDYDVVITPKGELKPRTSKREKFGSHTFGRDELERLHKSGTEVIVVGTGTSDLASLSNEAKNFAKQKGVEVIELPSQEAINRYNELAKGKKKVGAMIHITC